MTTKAPDRARRRLSLRTLGTGAVVIGAVLLIALLVFGVVSKAPRTDIDERLGRGESAPAPGFELPVLQRGSLGPRLDTSLRSALADGRVALHELRGTPVVLNFWASWCVPCREEAPLLERIWRAERSRGLLFLGLNMQDITADARDFLREFDVSYLNVRDQSNDVALDYGATGLPETFFITARGEVVAHVIGVIGVDQMRDGLAAARRGRPLGSVEGGDRRPTR